MNDFRKNAGFTLVEIAIVLVIIGLLLGGVLKGQEMIENARIKNLINDIDGVSAAIYAYQDRYKSLPGDDKLASNAGRGWTNAVAGDGNGRLADNGNPAHESVRDTLLDLINYACFAAEWLDSQANGAEVKK